MYVPGTEFVSGFLLPWEGVHVVKSVCSGAGFKSQLQLCHLCKLGMLFKPQFFLVRRVVTSIK